MPDGVTPGCTVDGVILGTLLEVEQPGCRMALCLNAWMSDVGGVVVLGYDELHHTMCPERDAE